MKIATKIVGPVAAVCMAFASAASALTTIDDVVTDGGADAPSISGDSSNLVTVTFDWSSAPATGFVEFTADQDFDLFLTGYSGAVGTIQYSGFMLREVGGASLTNGGLHCAGSSLSQISGACDLVSNSTGAGLGSISPSGSVAVLSAGPGTYYLGFYEGSAPATGSMSFQIASVPLPAAGLLLLGALGGLGMMRRRKG